MGRFRKSSATQHQYWEEEHRFEHWYRDNTVYFITSRVRNKHPAFDTEEAKAVFWNRFDHYCTQYAFVPWVTSLMNNHYHTLGYLKVGENLGPFMQKLHGSVAKLTNDLLPERHLPFWCSAVNQDYFDGCIRDEKQASRAYGYTLRQSVRAGLVRDWREYEHTRVNVERDRAITRATKLNAFLRDVRYKRYQPKRREGNGFGPDPGR